MNDYYLTFYLTFLSYFSLFKGVYAVQDKDGTVLYVGSSMTVASEIQRLNKKLGNDAVHSIRIQTFPTPKTEAIEAYKLELIRQLSPTGNLENAELWEDEGNVQMLKRESDVVGKKESVKSSTSTSTSRERLADAVGRDSNKIASGGGSGSTAIESPFAEVEGICMCYFIVFQWLD